jgi:PAS domain S-box-containing protein
MAVSGHGAILFYAIIYGKESGVYQIFIISGFFSFLYFDKTEKVKQILSFTITIISVIIFQLYFTFINIVPIRLTKREYEIMSLLTFYLTMILVFAAMANYYFQEKKTVEELSTDLDELGEEVDSQQKQLQDSRELYKTLFSKTNDAIFMIDISTGKYLDANKAGERITGRSVDRLRTLTINDVTPDGVENRLEIYKTMNEPQDMGEILYIQPDGEKKIGLLSVVPMGHNVVFGLVRDITELKRMDNLKTQSEKMLTVGILAAGMAHELNNPLAGILLNAKVMYNRLIKKSTISRNLDAAAKAGTTMDSIERFLKDRDIDLMMKHIIDSGERMSEIVNKMLNFITRSENEKVFHRPEEIIGTSLQLALRDFSLKFDYRFKDIKVSTFFEENLPSVFCDLRTIQQVLMNIFKNGAHAMQSIELKNPRFIIKCSNHASESMVSFEIENTGPVIDPEIIDRVFDPFFTTKEEGQGAGLGLAVSYFIITEDHKGHMYFEPLRDKGAKISILLPTTISM